VPAAGVKTDFAISLNVNGELYNGAPIQPDGGVYDSHQFNKFL